MAAIDALKRDYQARLQQQSDWVEARLASEIARTDGAERTLERDRAQFQVSTLSSFVCYANAWSMTLIKQKPA